MTGKDKITLHISEENANKLVDSMKNELDQIDNTLECYRSNNIANKPSYEKLLSEKSELEKKIDEIETSINEQTENKLGELFG